MGCHLISCLNFRIAGPDQKKKKARSSCGRRRKISLKPRSERSGSCFSSSSKRDKSQPFTHRKAHLFEAEFARKCSIIYLLAAGVTYAKCVNMQQRNDPTFQHHCHLLAGFERTTRNPKAFHLRENTLFSRVVKDWWPMKAPKLIKPAHLKGKGTNIFHSLWVMLDSLHFGEKERGADHLWDLSWRTRIKLYLLRFQWVGFLILIC